MTFAPGGVEQDCKVCRLEENKGLRERWGCDAEAPHELFEIECFVCDGANPKCPECHGTGGIGIRRCPFAVCQPRHFEVCTAAAFFDAHGVLPVEGGWAQQSATLIDALNLALSEKARYDELRMKKAQQQASKGARRA